jgi:hypothetical protein
VPAPDWAASFVAIWNFDEASGNRLASGGTCAAGTDCDLTDNNTVSSDAVEKVEGARSAYFDEAGGNSLRRRDVRRGGLRIELHGDVLDANDEGDR